MGRVEFRLREREIQGRLSGHVHEMCCVISWCSAATYNQTNFTPWNKEWIHSQNHHSTDSIPSQNKTDNQLCQQTQITTTQTTSYRHVKNNLVIILSPIAQPWLLAQLGRSSQPMSSSRWQQVCSRQELQQPSRLELTSFWSEQKKKENPSIRASLDLGPGLEAEVLHGIVLEVTPTPATQVTLLRCRTTSVMIWRKLLELIHLEERFSGIGSIM
jgi:hypothetical protein